MKKIKRTLSLLMTIIMFATCISIGAVSADSQSALVLTSLAEDGIFPVGSNVVIDVDTGDADGVEKIQLYASADGISKGEMIAEKAVGENSASYTVTLADGTNHFIASAVNASGTEVGSGSIVLNGTVEKSKNYLWNKVDFTNCTIGNSLPWRDVYKNGTRLLASDGSSYIGMHCGDNNNEIAIERNANATPDYGVSLKLNTKVAGTQVQTNNIALPLSSNIAVVEVDFCAPDFALTHIIGQIPVYTAAGAEDWSAPYFTTDTRGVFEVGGKSIVQCEPNRWYNVKTMINFDNDTFYYFLDNVLVYKKQLSSDIVRTMKVVYKNFNANATSTMYIDNLTAYSFGFPTVKLDCPQASYELPIGTKVSLDVAVSNIDDVTDANVKLLSSDNGATYSEYQTPSLTNNKASFKVELTEAPKFYIAELYEGNTLIAKTDAIKLMGRKETVISTVWDKNFEDFGCVFSGVLSKDASNAGRYIVNAEGDNRYLKVHVGTGGTITPATITDINGVSYGKSVKLTAPGNTTACQLNSLESPVLNNIAVYSADVLTTNLDGNNKKFFGGAYSNGTDFPAITGSSNGSLYVGGTVVGSYVANKWYNFKYVVNTETGIIDVFVDNVHVFRATGYPVAATAVPFRANVSTGTTKVTEIYFDNYKAYKMKYDVPETALSEVYYQINGVDADTVSDGTLAVTPHILNNGAAKTVTCIIAVYDGQELSDLRVLTHTFANGEIHYAFINEEFEAVEEGMIVKTMLWDSIGNATPLDSGKLFK